MEIQNQINAPLTGFWIKSHSAILDDVSIAMLPDNLWRRYSELKHILPHDSQTGDLPEAKAIAFRLRVPETQLVEELGKLASLGLIIHEGGSYSLPNFTKEQGADSVAVRQRRHREKQRLSPSSYDAVTNRDTDRKIDKKEQIDESSSDVASAPSENGESYDAEAAEMMSKLRERIQPRHSSTVRGNEAKASQNQ